MANNFTYESPNENYGLKCKLPSDLDPEEYENRMEEILNILKTNQSRRQEIERETINQYKSELWHSIRENMITSTKFAQVCVRTVDNVAPLIRDILYKDIAGLYAIRYGNTNEAIAIKQLEKQLSISIKKCGLFISSEYPFLGATPDGIVSENVLVEIMCPSALQGMDPDDAIKVHKIKTRYWEINPQTKEILGINKNHKCYYQIQGQLNICQRQKCIFAVWTGSGHPLKVFEVERDEEFWKTMVPKLEKFYFDAILPEIIDRRYPKNLPIREPYL